MRPEPRAGAVGGPDIERNPGDNKVRIAIAPATPEKAVRCREGGCLGNQLVSLTA
jgi:hypothetical protein